MPHPPDHHRSDDPVSDTANLADRMHQGDNEAFGKLYEKMASSIYAYACTRLGWRSGDAEDVVSEVWIRARQKFDTFDTSKPFRPWIFGYTVRVVLEYQARLARMAPGQGGGDSLSGLDPRRIPDEASSISRRVARDEELRRFLEWTRTLSEYEREVLLLRGLQGRPHDEISDLLGRTEDAVRQCWSRLKQKIAERARPETLDLID